MTDFPRNRFKTQELLETLKAFKVLKDNEGDWRVDMGTENELEIYFPDNDGEKIPNALMEKSKDVLKDLNYLDNLVQALCEKQSEQSSFHVNSFLLHLAYINITESEISLMYFGDIVNTQWLVDFSKDRYGNWMSRELVRCS